MKNKLSQELGETLPNQFIPKTGMTTKADEYIRQVIRETVRITLEESKLNQNTAPEKRQSDKVLSIEEVAEYIGMKACSIYGMIHRKSIPYIKMGRLVKFEKHKIDEWLHSSRRKTSKEISAEADRYLKHRKSL
jgi:excisionase family DNA binding protein